MANQDLIDFIKKSKAAGQADEQIKSALKQSGWQDADIEEGFKSFSIPTPAQNYSDVLYGNKQSANFITPENKSSKKLVIAITAIFILLAGGVSAYYFRDSLPVINNLIKKEAPAQQAISIPIDQNLPRMDKDKVKVRGFANIGGKNEDGSNIYFLSLSNAAGDWLEGKPFKYIRENCPEVITQENIGCIETQTRILELIPGKTSFSLITEKPKLIEVEGALKILKIPAKGYLDGYRSSPGIEVDSIKEIKEQELVGPSREGMAKILEEAIKTNNPNTCQKAILKDKEDRVIDDKSNTCLRELAITLQDPSMCALMKKKAVNDPFTPDNCYEALAYIKLDKNLCNKIELENYQCETNFLGCESTVANKKECLRNISIYEKALQSNNISECKSYEETYPPINEALGQASCVAEYAWRTKNLSSCDNLYERFMQVFYTKQHYWGLFGQEWCIYRNALSKKDNSHCDSLTDPLAKEICKK